LKFGGKFYVIYDRERTAELIFKLKQYGLEPKKILFTQPKDNSNAILVLVEAVKGGKEGVKILPILITNDKDGKYLEKIKNLKLNK
ncbi:MAG: SAM-dependent methyltransferase, partial [Clostridia bacterium]|nr:SAM-dependent methyltransferase [Clostridia bacterium]